MFNFLASSTAIRSRFISTTNKKAGKEFISLIPEKNLFNLITSASNFWDSLLVWAITFPLANESSNSTSLSNLFSMVLKLVIKPPSHLWLIYKELDLSAQSLIITWACFFVPTNKQFPPLETFSVTKLIASISFSWVLTKLIIWVPFFFEWIYSVIWGFHFLTVWPKWDPASNSSLIDIIFSLFVVVKFFLYKTSNL